MKTTLAAGMFFSVQMLLAVIISIPLFGSETIDEPEYNAIGTIGGRVWQDPESEVNGIFNLESDSLLQGIKVWLVDAETGNAIKSQTTDDKGEYIFSSVLSGSYQIQFIIPDNLTFVEPNKGDSDAQDSDVTDLINGKTDVFFFDAEDSLTNMDAGVHFGTLSVDLISFNGHWDGESEKVVLKWKTLQEKNSDYFVIMRAFEDEETMSEIGSITAISQSSYEFDYEYVDEDIFETGTYYYQITEVDYDGIRTKLSYIRIEVEVNPSYQLITYPNPTEDNLYVLLRLEEVSEVGFTMIDLSGRLVHIWQSQELHKGKHEIALDLPEVVSGQYILEASIGEDIARQVIFKK